MQKTAKLFVIMLAAHFCSSAQSNLKLWYNKPAASWNEALPIGNGRLGAMIFGNVSDELIQLNESTLWSGGPANTNPNPTAIRFLPEIRKALFAGDYTKAEELSKNMQGPLTASFEPLGDLRIRQDISGTPEEYYRDLNLSTAIATTHFKIAGVEFTREQFVSSPQQLIVVRLTASKANALNFSVHPSGPFSSVIRSSTPSEIVMQGRAPSHTGQSYMEGLQKLVNYGDSSGCAGMRFQLRVKLQSTDGKIETDKGGLNVTGASYALILLSAATSFNGFDKCPDKDGVDEDQLASSYLSQASSLTFDQLKKNHVQHYQFFFNRVKLELNSAAAPDLPTDDRLLAYSKGGKDPALEALYFQLGRYLLISSSQPGGPPSNPKGIWNHHVLPSRSSNYAININTEMNYWIAETCNLSELHMQLLDFIKGLAVTGKETATNYYDAPGWVAHNNSDIWAASNPVSGIPNWPMGGAWLCQHLWEHYQFTRDEDYLKSIYPVMRDAAEFCERWLIEDANRKLVTTPSISPENSFISSDGTKGTVSIATTMDMSLIRDLFSNVADAAEKLGVDEELSAAHRARIAQLIPFQIGRKGNLQEWYKDWEDAEPEHGHVSHLFGLFPGNQISPITTPDLANAARKSLELQGDGCWGWLKAWKINLWARLLDGNHAYKLLRTHLTIPGKERVDYSNSGGTYPNVSDPRPPFQIDEYSGGTSAIAEMLLQSNLDTVHLLPALPDAWQSGKVKGLRARGGFEIDIAWSNHVLDEATIRSLNGESCTLRTPQRIQIMYTPYKSVKTNFGYLTTFKTTKAVSYTVKRFTR